MNISPGNFFSEHRCTADRLHFRGALALGVWVIVVVLLGINEVAAAGIQSVNLRCEYRQNPMGIDVIQPRLSWTLEATSAASGLAQSSYQVLVSSTREKLASDDGDLWDSGTVASDQTMQVAYAGKPLRSRMSAWWKVRVRDQAGESSTWSAPATWTMGLLEPGDWQAQIGRASCRERV